MHQMRILSLCLLTFLCLLSCSSDNNTHASRIKVDLSTAIPVVSIGGQIAIQVTIDANYAGTLELSILGTTTTGLSLLPAKVSFPAGHSVATAELIASNTAVPTPSFNSIQLVAMTDGYLVSNALNIQVVTPGTITFTKRSVLVKTNNQIAVTLSIINNDFTTNQSVTVDFATSNNNIKVISTPCVFTENNTNCRVIISNTGVSGLYQVFASAPNYTISPLNVQVTGNNTISFVPDSITILTNGQAVAQLELVATNQENDIVVNLSSPSSNLTLVTNQCILNNISRVCYVLLSSNKVPGNYQVIASSSDFNIAPLNVTVRNPNTIAFNINTLNLLTNTTAVVELSLLGANNDTPTTLINLNVSDSGINISPTSCNLNYVTNSCMIVINSTNAVGNYQLIAIANGYDIEPVTINVTPPGTISFTSSAVTMLTNKSTQVNVILNGATVNSNPVTVSFTSDSANLQINPTSCILSAEQNMCTLTLTSNQVNGSYQVVATANNYSIEPLLVNVVSANTIQFIPNHIRQLPLGTQAFILTLSGAEMVDSLIEVKLATSSPNITISKSSCALSSSAPSCVIYEQNNGFTGKYQLQGLASGYNIVPVELNVVPYSSISFNQTQLNMLINNSYVITVGALPSSSILAPITVSLQTSNNNILLSTTTCILTQLAPSCPITITSQSEVGASQITASATGYDIEPLNVLVYNKGSIAFNPVKAFAPANQNINIQTTLQLIGATTGNPDVSVALASSNQAFTISPTNCNFTSSSTNCVITGTSATVGLYQITATSSDYAIAPYTVQSVTPGTISFAENTLALLTGNTTVDVLSLYAEDVNLPPITVSLTTSSPNAIANPGICVLSPAHSTCTVAITGTAEGNYQIFANATGYTINPVNLAVINSQIQTSLLGFVYPGVSYPLTIKATQGGTNNIVLTTTGSGSVSPNTCTLTYANNETCIVNFSIPSPGEILTIDVVNNGIMQASVTATGSGTDNNPVIIVNGTGTTTYFTVHAGSTLETGQTTITLQDGQACYIPAGWGFTSSGYFFIQTTDSALSYNALNLLGYTVPNSVAFSSNAGDSDGYNGTWARFWQGDTSSAGCTTEWVQAVLSTPYFPDFCPSNDSDQPYIVGIGQLSNNRLSSSTIGSSDYYNQYRYGNMSYCNINVN